MKRFLLLLLCWLVAAAAHAQSVAGPATASEFGGLFPILKNVFLPLFGLYLLCQFVLTTIRLVLAHLLKRQILDAAPPESVVQHLMPGPQDERNGMVKWIALLTSTGSGLALSSWYLPWGINSLIILLFSTALGFLAYYLYLLRQPK